MKVIKLNSPKGQYTIPLLPVVEHRTQYYVCERGGKEKGCQEWQEEVDWVMNDDFEGIDWLLNNTDWEDWKDIATKLNDKVKVTDDDFWSDSDNFEIVED